MCDIAYTLRWEREERQHLVLWQAAILAGAMGNVVEVPALHEAQQRFDEALAEPPKPRDRVRDATLRVMGGAA